MQDKRMEVRRYCRNINCSYCTQSGLVWRADDRVWFNNKTGDYVTHFDCEQSRLAENDEIEKPQHYTFTKPAKDCWDVLFESELLTDHLVASAVQYLLRCKKKGMYEKDLKKAATYIKKALEMYAEKTKGN